MADFVWGSGGRQLTPDEIAAERKYSQSLMQQATSTAPVGHWTQGLNRVLQGLLAGYAGYEANQATKRNETFTNDAVAKALASFDGGASTSASMPATTSAPVASPVPMAPATGGAPQSYFDAVKMAESSGNPAATNPNSSATGLYQFTTPTWNDLMRNRPELGLTPDGRLDPQQQERAMRAFTDQNAGVLSGAGIEASPANLYAAHFLGAGGARSVLGLPDNTAMMAAAGPEVVKANPFLANMTVGDFKNWAGQKVGGAVAPGAAPQILDANQPSPLDTAQWPAGPGGAPMDSAAIPPNARPTQGQLPAAGNFPLMAASTPSMPASASPGMPAIAQSAGRPAIHPEILKLMSSPYVSDTGRKIGALLFQGQMQSRGAELKAARELQARSSAAAQAGIDPRMASDPEIWKQAVAAQFGAPATATVGHDLINTRNGQPIYRGQADAPTSVSEYGFYADQEKAQGRQPLPYGQWDTARKKAGATSVPIQLGTQAPDGRLREKLDEGTAKNWTAWEEAGHVSAGQMQDMQMLDELMKVAPQGPLTGRLAEMFPGVSSAGDAFNAIVKRVAPAMRAPGSGSTSDIEYDGMLRSLPALRNNPNANVAISEMMKAKSAINIERADIISQYKQNQISRNDAEKRLSDLNKRSIMTPAMRQMLAGLGGKDADVLPGDVVDGYRFKGGNKADKSAWEKVQ